MKKPTYKSAKAKAWKVFSEYIRLRDCLKTTGTEEFGNCITCNKRTPFTSLQAGHFVGGRRNSVLFDENLVNAQCSVCNVFRRGAYQRYTLVMIERYGQKKVKEMLNQKHETRIYKVPELIELAEYYKEKIRQLEHQNEWPTVNN